MNSYRKVPTTVIGSENILNKIFPDNFVMHLKSLLGMHKRNNGEQPSFHSVFGYYRKVLDGNNRAIEIITDMNDKLGGDSPVDINYVKNTYSELCLVVNMSIRNFDIFTQNKYQYLHYAFNYIDGQIKRIISGAITRDLPEHVHSNSAGPDLNEYFKEKNILRYIAPLNLVDPMYDDFTPEGCKTIHDIIRFMHVTSVHELAGRSAGDMHSVPKDCSPALR